MAQLETIPKLIREKTLPDRLQKQHERRDLGRRLFVKDAPTPAAPEVEPVTPMPDMDQQELTRRRSVASQRARRGRMSTIFTDGDGLGG